MKMFASIATVRKNPTARSIQSREWWAIMDCCPELGRYYLEMVKREMRARCVVMKPAWGYHISLVRGEEPPDGKVAWDALQPLDFEFSYESRIETNGQYFWLPVFCDSALDMREAMGLPRDPVFPLHLSVAVIQT
jgi:hypothetical protein